MPEIKRTFTAGKMNKDLDERLVRNGEYREALNVQVRTTDGDSDGVGDAGVVQNIQGNAALPGNQAYSITGYDGNKTKIVANVSDEKNDVAYFFAAAPTPSSGIQSIAASDITSEKIWVDSIVEAKANGDDCEPIFVDRFAVTGTYANAGSPTGSPGYTQLTVSDASKYRVGDIVFAQTSDGAHLIYKSFNTTDGFIPGSEIVAITIADNTITLANAQSIQLSALNCAVMKFIHKERVLEFNYKKLITGVSVLDNLLLWTDNQNEPKKINITRSKEGTTSTSSHTQLFVTNPSTGDLVNISEIENVLSDIKKENITVIRKKPIIPPFLTMSDSDRSSSIQFSINGYNFVDSSADPIVPVEGTLRQVPIGVDGDIIGFPEGVDLRVDDILLFTDNSNVANPVIIRAKITEITTGFVTLRMLFVDVLIVALSAFETWDVVLEQDKSLFETKFGRFAYRYKYEDGECSAFSPWSELAFLPGGFSYTPSKGFNLGMENNLRVLKITGFIPDDVIRPSDVESIDILFKTTDNANVYIVKTITREIDSEWEFFTDSTAFNTGSIEITSEVIQRVLPENQILRGWDNVPRYALSQEITANRLVYGNYTQGYNIEAPIGLKQTIDSSPVNNLQGTKSVKSNRNYKFGLVYGDEYGRETPVISSGYVSGVQNQPSSLQTISGDIVVEKILAHKSNKFTLQQNWEDLDQEPQEWMNYVKYYVKETSNEYYNLVMDRWYNAEDKNIWISFPSADRNKVDEQTYLILKNENGGQLPVEEKAKYKILAIENEAPDYIKLDYRKMDRVKISRLGVYLGDENTVTDANPIKLYSKNLLKTSGTFWNARNLKRSDFKGIPKVRVVAEYYGSVDPSGGDYATPVETFRAPWKTLSRIIDADAEERGVVLKEAYTREEVDAYLYFSQEVGGDTFGSGSDFQTNIADVDDENSPYYIQYFMEFADLVVENKPEFDGRFFVKIEKDDVLNERVLKKDNEDYTVSGTYKIAYIANSTINPAVNSPTYPGTYNASSWPDEGSVFNSSQAETLFGLMSFPAPNNGNSLNVSFWENWNTIKETNIFLDGVPTALTAGTAQGIGYNEGVYNSFNWWINVPYYAGLSGTTVKNLLNSAVYGIDTTGNGDPYWTDYNNDGEDGYPYSFSSINTVTAPFPQFGLFSNFGSPGLTPAVQNGERNVMILSTISEQFQPGQDSQFKSRMQTEGQRFRFRGDPLQNVYKVIKNNFYYADTSSQIAYQITIDQTDVTIQSHNFYGGGQLPTKNRESIVVKFVRLDGNGNEIFASGIDCNVWDPRGQVLHNGTGYFVIETLDEVDDEDAFNSVTITDHACWETEPKDDSDLDIYYEASAALPLRLDTIQSMTSYFLPDVENGSPVNVSRRYVPITQSTLQDFLINNTFISKVYNNNTITVREINSTGSGTQLLSSSDGIGIAINDELKVSRKDGTVVFTKVLDHMKIVNSAPTPSDRYLDVDGIFSFVNTGQQFLYVPNNIVGFTNGLSNSQIEDLVIGMEVTGPAVIPEGTFITGVLFGLFYAVSNNITIMGALNNVDFITTTGNFKVDVNAYEYPVQLSWFNCYSFGNGVESDRIRDDFNAPQIDNGCRVSSTFLEYGEEQISSGLIHSGLYNSTSSVNNLNEFNMAEKITKNINPAYGSIQALKTRDNNLVVFSEDKVLKVLANKDAVFNADGNSQLVATNRVLGDATPFVGDYGISKNPESLASDQYRLYFTDKQRGAVLRLSMDGLTPISNVGMKTYFRENLKLCKDLVGTFDIVNGEYNLSLNIQPSAQTTTNQPITISFNEGSKGWVSFKSFVPDTGISVSGKYLTSKDSLIYEHHRDLDFNNDTVLRNNFYGTQYNSEIEVVFNDLPSNIKSFHTINYEGTQAKVNQYTQSTVTDAAGNTLTDLADGEYYNLTAQNGWYVNVFNTDLQQGSNKEFKNKEGKWFSTFNGESTSLANIDASEISVQGIGFPSDTNTPSGGYGDVNIDVRDKGDNP